MLLLEGYAAGGKVVELHAGIVVDNLLRLVAREHRAQTVLARHGKADVDGMPLSDRQQLVERIGTLRHILHLTDALTGMNDVVSNGIHMHAPFVFLEV